MVFNQSFTFVKFVNFFGFITNGKLRLHNYILV
jgi:hypothetical protein